MKILCIGHTSFDISCPVDSYPVENTKYRLTEKVAAGGGPASNAAYLLGKWGMDTTIATVVGSDDFGEKIKREFSSVNVNTNYIETSYDKETSLSFILINKTNGTRTVFNVAGDFAPLKKYDYDFTPDIIYTDGHDYGAVQNAISKFPNAIRIIDAGRVTQELLELCKYMNYIVCSKGFAETVTGLKIDYNDPNTLVNIYTKLKNKYLNANIVVTLEEKGALYFVNNQIKIMPGLKVEAKDTTGAGDIFHGAFTYGIANNFDLEKTITFANIAGGLSVKTVGSRLSVPPLSDVLEYYNKTIGPVSNTQEPSAMENNPSGENNLTNNQTVDTLDAPDASPSPESQTPVVENIQESQIPVDSTPAKPKTNRKKNVHNK